MSEDEDEDLDEDMEDDGRVYKNPRNSPSNVCPRDEEHAAFLVSRTFTSSYLQCPQTPTSAFDLRAIRSAHGCPLPFGFTGFAHSRLNLFTLMIFDVLTMTLRPSAPIFNGLSLRRSLGQD